MYKQIKDYLIPHEGNDYNPRSLQKAAVAGMVVLILLSFTLANLQSLIWMSSEWMVSTILPAVIVDMTNQEREGLQLSGLKRNATLDLAAKLKAQDMATHEYFAHYSPAGVSPWHWFGVANYNFVHAGENLAIHFTDSGEVIQAWMDSPAHRANIVNENYSEIGVGTAQGTYEGFKTVYVVQLFGTPAADPIEISETEVVTEEVAVTPPTPVLAEAESIVEDGEVVTTLPVLTTVPTVAGSEETVEEVASTTVTLSSDRDPVEISQTNEFEDATATASTSEFTETVNVAIVDEGVVLYSDPISTSTGGIPASIEYNNDSSVSTPPVLLAATQPHKVLQVVYSVIALFVLLALTFSICIEIRRQQPIQVAYSAGLIVVMLALFYVHTIVTSGALIA